MTEMDPRQDRIDNLLRTTLAAPVPSLPQDFDRRLMDKLDQSSQGLDRFRRILLAGYGLVSMVTCAVVMRGEGLEWATIAVTILAPVVSVVTVSLARHALRH